MKWKTMEELSTRFRTSQGHLYNHYLEKRQFRGLYIHRRRVTDDDRETRDDLKAQHVWLYCANTTPPDEHLECDVCGEAVTPRRHRKVHVAHSGKGARIACIECHRQAFIDYDDDARNALGVCDG